MVRDSNCKKTLWLHKTGKIILSVGQWWEKMGFSSLGTDNETGVWDLWQLVQGGQESFN